MSSIMHITNHSIQLLMSILLIIITNHMTIAVLYPDAPPPNIIFLMAHHIGYQDLGLNDCSTSTLTPFLDSLITQESLYLNNHYVPNGDTASRAAFLSGRYPSNIGLYDIDEFTSNTPYSLTRQISIISEEFKSAGYSTHFIGTWDLGYQSWEYTPTYRGFDTFSGSLHSFASALEFNDQKVDFWNNEQVISDMVMTEEYRLFWEGTKTLDLLAELKQSEDSFFVHIVWGDTNSDNDIDDDIRIQSMDESIGDIVRYLKTNGLWDNTLIVFSSDYGVENGQSDESTVWEGAVRVPAFVTGGVLSDDRKGLVLEEVTSSMTDWYPTLLSAAGIETTYPRSRRLHGTDSLDMRFEDDDMEPLDGMDLWPAISTGDLSGALGSESESREILIDLDGASGCQYSSCGAIRAGNWKFIRGSWSENTRQSALTACLSRLNCDEPTDIESAYLRCSDSPRGCLFDLDSDPCELEDVGGQHIELVQKMARRLDAFASTATSVARNDDAVTSIDDAVGELSDRDSMTRFIPFMEYDDVRFEDALRNQFMDFGEYDDFGDGMISGGGGGWDHWADWTLWSGKSAVSGGTMHSYSNMTQLESASSIHASGSTVVHRILVFGMVLFALMAIILICVFLQLGKKQKKKRNGNGNGNGNGHVNGYGGISRDAASPLMQ